MHLWDYGSYNPRQILGRNRISLPDGTFLEQVGLSSFTPCTPLSGYHLMVENAGGEVLRRRSFLTYERDPKKVNWNTDRCSESWGGESAVIAAVHYRSVAISNIYIIADKILFLEGKTGCFLLTTPKLDGPTSDSPLVVVDVDVLESTENEGASLEARDAALDRALRERK